MYVFYNPNPNGRLDGEDCVVRAIAKATGQSWEYIYTQLCVYGLSAGTWGNSNAVWDRYLRYIDFDKSIIPNTCPYCYTVSDFAKDNPKGVFVLATGTHAIAVIDGNYYDIFDSGAEVPIYYYKRTE